MGFTCGIIGLPNVGKSTIFNALTAAKAESANYPFCTIDPNTGVVSVPDQRLQIMAELASSAKIIPAQITFLDIAGLIRGAAQGEGLGNQFLGHIRSVDAIAHVVRCFEDENVVHVDGSVDPVRDIDTIDTELVLADFDSIEKQLTKLEKNAKSNDKDAKARFTLVKQIADHLGSGKPARSFEPEQEFELLAPEYMGNLLTAKPVLFVANVAEEDAALEPIPDGDSALDKLGRYAASEGTEVVVISGKVESEISELDLEERTEYLEELGLERSGLDRWLPGGE